MRESVTERGGNGFGAASEASEQTVPPSEGFTFGSRWEKLPLGENSIVQIESETFDLLTS